MKKLLILSILFSFFACEDDVRIPKPPTYLRLELPEHTYKTFKDNCQYTFSIPPIYTVKPVIVDGIETCHKDIDLGPLNGSLHLSYIEMEEPLSSYVNYVNDKIDEHKIKATAINDKRILLPETNVYCTFFALEGNVASPFQFYLTDSLDHFVSGVVYFNSTPNYDSLKPTLDYLQVDLDHFIQTFEWK